jgi:uncharacterized protein with HEPN domain
MRERKNNIAYLHLEHSEIPWRIIVGLRNALIHGYMDVDIQVVWQIITTDLPQLYKQIAPVLEPL